MVRRLVKLRAKALAVHTLNAHSIAFGGACEFLRNFEQRSGFLLLQESFRGREQHFEMNGHFVLMGKPIETPVRTRYPVAIAVHADHAHNILPDTLCQPGCAIGVAVKFLDGIFPRLGFP